MNVKNTTAALLSGVLALTMLSACSAQEKHTHTASVWDRDIDSHWQACECGEKMGDAIPHNFVDNQCDECSTIIDKFAGKIILYNFNDVQDMLRSTEYNTDSEVLSDDRYTYQYDENGNYVHVDAYYNGRLADRYDYSIAEDGENYISKLTSLYEDGSSIIYEYDVEGNTTATHEYDAEEKLVSEAFLEYTYLEDGECYLSRVTDHTDGYKYITEYNVYGDITRWCEYEKDDLLTDSSYEYEYDEEGRMLSEKIIENGMTVQECYYVITESADGWESYAETIIDYFEDGTKIVAKYDENRKFVEETTYDADGNVIGLNG